MPVLKSKKEIPLYRAARSNHFRQRGEPHEEGEENEEKDFA
jgi:hypothetical protein